MVTFLCEKAAAHQGTIIAARRCESACRPGSNDAQTSPHRGQGIELGENDTSEASEPIPRAIREIPGSRCGAGLSAECAARRAEPNARLEPSIIVFSPLMLRWLPPCGALLPDVAQLL